MINKISDTIVYNTLKNIKHGYLEIINFEGDVLKFGDLKEDLKVKIIIKHPDLNYKLIRYLKKNSARGKKLKLERNRK